MDIIRSLALKIAFCVDWTAEIVFLAKHRSKGLAHKRLDTTRETVNSAIALGLQFIMKAQRLDGSFRGFLLPPGASRAWITAHIAFVLENVPYAKELCLRSAKYLYKLGCSHNGWGYNCRVPNDSDSTSQALMVLHKHEMRIPTHLVDHVAKMQHENGGFPTYRSTDRLRNGWESPHADVTILVIEMLKRVKMHDERRNKAIEWLNAQVVDGIITPYWWTSYAYCLWAQDRTGFRTGEASDLAKCMIPCNGNVPELAMLLNAALSTEIDKTCLQGITALLAQQKIDGSWECGPCLRVTNPSEFRAGLNTAGTAHYDARRLFSTAHAVAALAKAETCLVEAIASDCVAVF